ncbi:MAG: LysR substrate-binding domain-containing protein [Burkholderiales bacterium]
MATCRKPPGASRRLERTGAQKNHTRGRACLPPLNALHCFEVAAQHLSFKRAGEILHKSPSAIRYEVKLLETQLGVPLFHRLNRGLQLTDKGRAFLGVVRQMLACLEEGTARLKPSARTSLRILSSSALASEVVLPSLPEFLKQHPTYDVRIDVAKTHSAGIANADIGLFFGRYEAPGLEVEDLLKVDTVPVASPAYLRQHPWRGAQSLHKHVLIHASLAPRAWPMWARRCGLRLGPAKQDLWLDNYVSILDAAERGIGITLGLMPIINRRLASGRLVVACPQVARQFLSYCLVRKGGEARPQVDAFVQWLRRLLSDLSRSSPSLRRK